MARQDHLIGREIIEVTVASDAAAHGLHDMIARLHAQTIGPLLDRICTDAGIPERIERIERLEIDLGSLDPLDFEADFATRLGRELPDALRTALADRRTVEESTTGHSDEQHRKTQGTQTTSGSAAPIGSAIEPMTRPLPQHEPTEPTGHTARQLELLLVFLDSGLLPWWADRDNPRPVEASIAALLDRAPAAIRDILVRTTDGHRRRRLVNASTDEHLIAMISLLDPSSSAAMSQSASAVALHRSHPDRRGALAASLETAIVQRDLERVDFRRAVLVVLMGQRGRNDIEQAHHGLAAQILGHVEGNTGTEEGTASFGRSPSTPDLEPEIPRVPGRPAPTTGQRSGAGDAGLEGPGDRLRRLLNELPQAAWKDLSSLLRELRLEPHQSGLLLAATLTDRALPRQMLDRITLLVAPDDGGPPRESPSLRPSPQRERPSVPVDLSFSESDTVWVDNAGIVLLAPFLDRFFTRRNLVVNQQFVDPRAALRAAGLLHHLATGIREPLEHDVALAKVMSGLSIDVVFEFDPPVTDEESAEADLLLDAVIEHAASLGRISPAGMRSTFLRRSGALSIDGDGWLLRIERETFDVVLDRLPWAYQWVRLPWMAAPLRVEW